MITHYERRHVINHYERTNYYEKTHESKLLKRQRIGRRRQLMSLI